MIGPGSDKNVGNFQQKMDTSTRFQFGWQEKQIGALSLRNIAFAGEGGGSGAKSDRSELWRAQLT